MTGRQKAELNASKMPTFDRLMNPLLRALKELGGSGTVQEIYGKVVEMLDVPDAVLDVLHGDAGNGQTEIEYRLAWARTYLKKFGMTNDRLRTIMMTH